MSSTPQNDGTVNETSLIAEEKKKGDESVAQHNGLNTHTNEDLIIDDGFPALSDFQIPNVKGCEVDKEKEKADKVVFPCYSFGSFPSCLDLNPSFEEQMLQDCGLAFTARSKEDSEAYSTGATFFVPSLMKPRCALEALALKIFQQHTQHLTPNKHYNPENSGAEFWTLILDSIHRDEDEEEDEEDNQDEDDEDDDEVGMHFDADYGLEEQLPNYMIHPRVATVTYLTSVGVPTLILEKSSPPPMDTSKTSLNGDIRNGWLSYPQKGKHIAFDGRLLHGAPGAFFPPYNNTLESQNCDSQKRRKLENGQIETRSLEPKRVTFMVNIWLNHCPIDAELMDQELCQQMKTPWNQDNDCNQKQDNRKKGDDHDEKDLELFSWNSVSVNKFSDSNLSVVPLSSENIDTNFEEHVMCGHAVKMTFHSKKETCHYVSKQISQFDGRSGKITFGENALTLQVGDPVDDDDEDDQ